ncbi:MAG: CvpA family protein [Deltaproteobacteria bacterium]|nr:CvpA family protein [Deltaproteobacteria bacterium]
MNLLDLGIVLLLALITLRGYYRGLFQELAVLAGVVGGVLVAAHTYLRLALFLQPWLKDPLHARIAAFAVVLVAVYWLTRLGAYLLQRLLYHLYLDLFDRLLGAFFALAKGALILGFALMFLGVVLPKDSRLFRESRTAPQLMYISRQALELLPPEFKERVNDFLKGWKKDKGQAGSPRGGMDLHEMEKAFKGLVDEIGK